jgi:predicted ester cyclase
MFCLFPPRFTRRSHGWPWTRGLLDLLQALKLADVDNRVRTATGPQGRDGWRETYRHLHHDLRPLRTEVHHLFGNDEHACVSTTLHAVHVASTMPLLAGVPVTGRQVAWHFTHVFRVATGASSSTGPPETTSACCSSWEPGHRPADQSPDADKSSYVTSSVTTRSSRRFSRRTRPTGVTVPEVSLPC